MSKLLIAPLLMILFFSCADKKSEIVDAQIKIKAEREQLNKTLESLDSQIDEVVKQGIRKRMTMDIDSMRISIESDRDRMSVIEKEVTRVNNRLYTLTKQYDSLEMELKRY